MKKILILGSRGMLGQELVLAFSLSCKGNVGPAPRVPARSFLAEGGSSSLSVSDEGVVGWDKEDLDVTNFPLLEEKIAALKPSVIINATAYNDVDVCEKSDEEYQKALKLNRDVPGKLAEIVAKIGAILVHYSTDYVFGGDGDAVGVGTGAHIGAPLRGYDETAPPSPLSRYGQSKWEGEKVLALAFVETRHGASLQTANMSSGFYLIRLSRLFGRPAGSGKKSFFVKMLELSQTQEELKAVNDEVGCFTYAPDLAKATKKLIEEKYPFGIYHLPNEGEASWYDGVVELFNLSHPVGAGFKPAPTPGVILITPVPASTFPRPARRPSYSALANTKFPKLRHYHDALAEFLEQL
ncbi:MAG: dTDP-4-dehydrorhamnose reductase [Parcubacteria group bacterium Gr01-1014_18]|nr:MAG: dTDP-4-dehydrorhamnose reductase [Parcubacteria group bacterium Greene0416_36]TSC80984.1 MAG: dTDP-4-dehydrorhamnose reductase [Parcubacteria group bacterium Gr01-1014_18]TSC98871.1 MAG: dTDP-4-dehydrorhamnose reductase [Parcubacteria group bacterium Greene1014_20]TSD06543.1 MAG: dTDP-4-dehydrorhamnose reductase [Parcubacteria group bacterium Greene0714_2]